VLGAVTLFVHLPDVARRPLAELGPLADELDAAMRSLASSIRTGTLPSTSFALRHTHVLFTSAIDAGRPPGEDLAGGALVSTAAPDVTSVVTETDLMVDSVDGIAELLASGASCAPPADDERGAG
jgi:hypothetical protein